MKELFWFGAFLLVLTAASLVDDYRAERCAATGGKWTDADGCGPPATCERGSK